MSTHAHLSTPDPEWINSFDNTPLPNSDGVDPNVIRAFASKARIEAMAKLGPLTVEGLTITNRELPVPNGIVPLRLYIPEPELSDKNNDHPVLVWLYGGGFWLGGIDDDDFVMRSLCVELQITIVSVGYRRAPEHPFPTALDDSTAALKWIVTHPLELHTTLSKGLIVAGLSSGGNIATVVVHRASQDPELKGKVTGLAAVCPALIHPDAYPESLKSELLSFEQNKDFVPYFTRSNIDHMLNLYNPPDPSSPEMSPLLFPRHKFKDLPPLYIQVDGGDPLRDEAMLYERFMREAGVATKMDIYPGFPHGFHVMLPHLKASQKKRDEFKEGIAWLLRIGSTK